MRKAAGTINIPAIVFESTLPLLPATPSPSLPVRLLPETKV